MTSSCDVVEGSRIAPSAWRCTLLFATGYVLSCLLGQLLSLPGVPFATFWPASGLYLAVLTLAERRDLPRLIAGAVAANLFFDVVINDRALAMSAMFCLANTAEALVGSTVLRFLRVRIPNTSHLIDFFRLACAGIVSALCGASVGMSAIVLSAGQAWDSHWWLLWWSADVIGILLTGPIVLSWWTPSPLVRSVLRSPMRIIELVTLLVLVGAAAWRVGGQTEDSAYSLPYGIFPLLVWAAVRFGVRGVSLALVVFFAAILQATVDGRGLFALGHSEPVLRYAALQFSALSFGFTFICLASVMDDRNQALEEARLSRLAAERASTAKSQFLANMSHEFRTPMNGILGMADLVLDSPLTARQQEHLGLLRRSAESLLRLLNDILDLSKVEAGRLELHPNDFSLRTCLQEIVGLVGPQAENKGLSLTCQVAPDVPDRIYADPERLRQVLLNLLSNALKFTPQGAIRLEVRNAATSADERVLHFVVSDTGIGIASADHERMFARFEQGGSGHDASGTGLGLSIVRQLVDLMGGRVWLESARGRGSSFHFTIRMRRVGEARPLPPPPTSWRTTIAHADEAAPPSAEHTQPVLLAEDDPVSALVVKHALESVGFRVLSVADGREAAAAWKPGKFSLVLSDMRMPEMNGLELARDIRRREESLAARTPIVILTASAQQDEFDTCRSVGVDAYLSKPLSRTDLLGVLMQLGLCPPEHRGGSE